jgi:hypothetical protein
MMEIARESLKAKFEIIAIKLRIKYSGDATHILEAWSWELGAWSLEREAGSRELGGEALNNEELSSLGRFRLSHI